MQAAQGLTGPDGLLPVVDPGSWDRFGVKSGALQPTMRSTGEVDLKPIDRLVDIRSVISPPAAGGGVADAPSLGRAVAGRLTGPIQFVLKLLEFWRLERRDAVGLLGFDQVDANHVAAVLDGLDQFRGRDVKDRIGHLYSVFETLRSLFQDLDVENDWLREPQPLLGSKTPLALVAGSMEDLLLVSEFVDEMAGW